MNPLLPAALTFAERGWPVFPLHSPTEFGCSCSVLGCDRPGEHPRTSDGVVQATTDAAQIHAWWTEWPHSNVGIRTGGDGPTVVSAESAEAADAFGRFRKAAGSPPPRTLWAISGRANQLYFQSPPGLASVRGRLPFDIIAQGGYVAAPPSLEADLAPRRFQNSGADVEPLPDWLIDLAAMSFPTEVLPSPLAVYVREAAASLGCPSDLVAVPLLGAIGTAIGDTRSIELKKDWTESARIFAAVIAPPGTKKSPALKRATRSLAMRQEELSQPSRRSRGTVGQGAPRVMTTDATTEALAAVLAENPRGIGVVADELTGWVRSMDQYKRGRGSDRQRWLSFWSGSQVIIDRRGLQEPLVLPRPFVCLVGCLPPDVVSELADDRGREDGFLDRILFSYPANQLAGWTETTVSEEVAGGHDLLFQKLWALEGDQDGPLPVRFSAEGRAAWIEWANGHYAECQSVDPRERGAWAKLDAYCARLILILHCARQAAGEADHLIDADTVSRGSEMVRYFKAHLRRVHARRRSDRGDSPEQRMLAWIRRHDGRATIHQLVTNNVAGAKTAAEAEAIAGKLETAGAVSIETIARPAGGRVSRIVRITDADAA